jgi:predicted ATPase with chaperone activity
MKTSVHRSESVLMAANFRSMEGHNPCPCFLLATTKEDSIPREEQTGRHSSSVFLDTIEMDIELLG